MSMRIHRAIGYGMPWDQFKSLCKLDLSPGNDKLWDVFSKATAEELTVPEEVRKTTWNTKHVSAIIETQLLSETYTEGGRKSAKNGKATDLYQAIGYDETEHVLFFPSLLYAKKWHHWDDDVDYAFERWREGGHRGNHGEPREIATYCQYGHYPFGNDLMLEDGTPIPWTYHFEVAKHDEWRPGIPSEIRWYLKHLGVLDDAGVNQLRPMIAQWWS